MNCKQGDGGLRHAPVDSGVVRIGELYTLQALKLRLGFKDAALRSARRAGLRVLYFGGRGFVLGDDLIAFLCSDPQRSSE